VDSEVVVNVMEMETLLKLEESNKKLGMSRDGDEKRRNKENWV